MATRYRAMAAPVDVSTGDGRRFAPGAIVAAEPPLPIRYVPRDIGGHDGAITVGRMDDIEVTDGAIYGVVTMFDDVDPVKMPALSEAVHEAMKYIEEGVIGLSVDLDDFDAVVVPKGADADAAMVPGEVIEEVEEEDSEREEEELELLITRGRIRAATLVDIPAFAETKGQFERLEEAAITASVSGDTELPVLEDREHPWDGPAAAQRVFDAYSDEEGNVDKSRAGRAFLWVDGDGTERGHYKLPFADIVDGELRIIPRGVAATAGGRGVDSADIEDKDAVKSRICSLYARVRQSFEDWPECPFDRSEGDEDEPNNDGMGDASANVAAILASMGAVAERTAFRAFTPPVAIDKPTPMTYDFERGVVYGHIYQHGVCHVGIPHECRTPPVDEDFRHFHVYPVETTEGTVFAGRITAGGGHPDRSLSLTAVRRAYDDKTTVAYVRASVDDHGIFVCGPLETGLDSETLGVLSRRKVSGHWPEVGNEGEIFLAEVLALAEGRPEDSEPGFPIGVHVRNGRVVGMTASLGPVAPVPEVTVERNGQPEVFQMTPEGLATLFRETYRLMEVEKVNRERATVARQGLLAAMEVDAEMMRADLARAIGE
jgi:hypothetical protein